MFINNNLKLSNKEQAYVSFLIVNADWDSWK